MFATSRLRLILFTAFGLLTLWVMLQVEVPMLLGLNPEWDKRVAAYISILHVHAAAGVVALCSGALACMRTPGYASHSWHRKAGYVYVLAVGIAAPLAIWISAEHMAANERLPALVQGLLWLLCTGAAIQAALKQHLASHQRWIYRSYALTSTFVFTRLLVDVAHWQVPAQWGGAGSMLWLSSIGAFMLAEWLPLAITARHPAVHARHGSGLHAGHAPASRAG